MSKTCALKPTRLAICCFLESSFLSHPQKEWLLHSYYSWLHHFLANPICLHPAPETIRHYLKDSSLEFGWGLQPAAQGNVWTWNMTDSSSQANQIYILLGLVITVSCHSNGLGSHFFPRVCKKLAALLTTVFNRDKIAFSRIICKNKRLDNPYI